MNIKENNTSTIEILELEQLIKNLSGKINYDDITDEFKEKKDSLKVLSQLGAVTLYNELNKAKINFTDLTDEYNSEKPSNKKGLSQEGAKALLDFINKNKVDFQNLTGEYNPENPSTTKILTQVGAKKMFEDINEDVVNVSELTDEYIVKEPSLVKGFNQKGANDLYLASALKKDIVSSYQNETTKETLKEEELKNKIFSLKGARDFFRYVFNNYVSRHGSNMLGTLLFPINNEKNGVGIKFSDNEDGFKLHAENELSEEGLKDKILKLTANSTDIFKVFKNRVVNELPMIFTSNIGAKCITPPKYNITLQDKYGINVEGDNLVFYSNDKKVLTLGSEGAILRGSRVSTEDFPVNAVSIDIKEEGHQFNNQLVCFFEGKWKLADLNKDHTADGWAIKIDDDTFRVYFSGLIHLDNVLRDDEDEKLLIGEYYFVSQDKPGALRRNRYLDGIEQIALKTVFVNGALKGQLLLTDEANMNMLTNFSLDDHGNVTTVETIKGLIETMETFKEDVKHLNEKIDDLESVVGDYNRLYENTFVEENKENHPFTFNAVYNNGTIWEMANLKLQHTADAIAIKKDDNKYLLVTKGTVDIPVGSLDDEGNPFVTGEYYYVSPNHPGKFARNKSNAFDVDQLAFKTIMHKGKLKAIVLISEETNIDY